jgi:hypothetical protein
MIKLEIELIRDVDDIKPFEPIWREISKANGDNRFYLSYDWFYPLIHLSKKPLNNFHILLIKKDAKTVGIFPFLLVKKRKRIFRLKTLQLAGNAYTFEQGAAIQNSLSKPAAEAITNYLFNEFSNSWDIIEFRSISPFDDFQSNLNLELQKKGAAFYQYDQFTNIVTDLSQFTDFEEFNKTLSKNFKRKIIKSINKMNRAGEFTIRILNEQSKNIADSLDSYHKIYSKSWKSEEQDPTFHRRLGEYLHSKGMLRLFILCFRPDNSINDGHSANAITSISDSINSDNRCHDDSIPIASYFAIQQGNKTYGLKTAYDTEYSNFSPGSVLLYFLTKYLINEEKSTSLNHQKGTEQFKYHIGGRVFAEYLYCYAANKHSFLGTIEVLMGKHLVPIYRNYSKSQLLKRMHVNTLQRRDKPSTR